MNHHTGDDLRTFMQAAHNVDELRRKTVRENPRPKEEAMSNPEDDRPEQPPKKELKDTLGFEQMADATQHSPQPGKKPAHSSGHGPDELASPTAIGPYQIIQTLGEGGMGTVYLAEQKHPVSRQVALKVIKLGMDTKEVIARFESERQALALMNHPHIAKVFDAGTTDRGRPFFVMEYVPGVSITRYCDENRLTTQERLELLMRVCEAIQHAHQKGIIHRDLKPTNILVTGRADSPAPKIIDFGLSKAMGHRLTEKSLHTAHGVLIGTPAYMSPEQAEPAGIDIDTRADVYALGVILYELLVGKLPFDFSEAVRNAAFDEVRKRIREEDPPKPSTRFSLLGETSGEFARRRSSAPSALMKKLKGDLDWITLKALEKHRERRYPTALELRADIDRYLHLEPVHASPPSTLYRVRKYVQRRAGFVAAVTLVALVLLVGATTSTFLYLDAVSAREVALQRTQEARDSLTLAQSEADRANTALAKEAQARQAAEGLQRRERKLKDEAQEAQAHAEAQRNEILRYSDLRRLSDARTKADSLWPAHPENIAELQEWIEQAEELARNLPTHRTSLDQLESLSAGFSEAPPGNSMDPAPEAELTFPDTETQWRHETLSRLVNQLAAFTDPDPKIGLLASMKSRLEFASTIEKRSLVDYQSRWEVIALAIRETASSTDEEFILSPQMGLIPLGKDPDSGLFEFLHLQTHEGPVPSRNSSGRLPVTEKTGIILVLLPGGEFDMGAIPPGRGRSVGTPNCDPEAISFEAPVHPVRVSPFLLAKYEMTQGQWLRVTNENPSEFSTERDYSEATNPLLHPVESVSWDDCRQLMTRLGLALPTEAQWEYAARAGTSTIWWTGNEKSSLEGAANIADLRLKKGHGLPTWDYDDWLDDGHSVHAPVGSYLPNPSGLHDIHGNVWEWCEDRFSAYTRRTISGDQPRSNPTSLLRINRGGSFSRSARNVRTARRRFNDPDYKFDDLGVRPARRLNP